MPEYIKAERVYSMDINQKITEELGVKKWQVDAAVKLIDEGNTIPFIARYRKEATGTLDDEQLRKLHERLTYLRNLEEKKEQVLSSIEEQGKLTEELRKQILAAETLVVVEDLYRPYRPKNKGDHSEGEGIRTSGGSHNASEDEAACRGDRGRVHRSGEGRQYCRRGGCRGERHHCRKYFR